MTDLLALLPASCEAGRPAGAPDCEVTGLAYHSARVRPGDLFVAIRGGAHDGHRYAADAVRRGAAAVLVERALPDVAAPQILVPDTRAALAHAARALYGDPTRALWVCGVTGTNGKTTVTCLLEGILATAGRRVGLIGTLGARARGAAVEFHGTTPTTPEAADVQRLCAEMRAAGVQDVVMEVTSHALVLGRVDGCRFGAAAFTNLTQDHLDFHGDLARYREAKSRLFAMLEPDGIAAVNADDPSGEAMAARSRAPVWTYAIDRPAEVRGEALRLGPRGSRFSVAWPGGRFPVALGLPGRFNVANALAAAAVALARGVAPAVVASALEAAPGVPGRCELVDEGQEFAVIVDYAHTPDGLEKILRLAAEVAAGRRIVVFGCGGDRDRTKRPIMGRIGTTLADYAVFTSDNPRHEDPAAIIREIEAGAAGRRFECEPDRRRAIGRALGLAGPGDVVVIAGKGHEPYQIVGDRMIEFDDRAVAREWLRAYRRGARGIA